MARRSGPHAGSGKYGPGRGARQRRCKNQGDHKWCRGSQQLETMQMRVVLDTFDVAAGAPFLSTAGCRQAAGSPWARVPGEVGPGGGSAVSPAPGAASGMPCRLGRGAALGVMAAPLASGRGRKARGSRPGGRLRGCRVCERERRRRGWAGRWVAVEGTNLGGMPPTDEPNRERAGGGAYRVGQSAGQRSTFWCGGRLQGRCAAQCACSRARGDITCRVYRLQGMRGRCLERGGAFAYGWVRWGTCRVRRLTCNRA